MASWPINEAKERFSELVDEAQNHGPQIITALGTEQAVILSIEEYRSLAGAKLDFKAYLMTIPKMDDLDIERDQDCGRDIDFG